MKKRIFTFLFVLTICLSLACPVLSVSAAGLRVVDNADLLTESQESTLLTRLDDISNQYNVDVAVVTVDSLDGRSPMTYADDYFDNNGYGMGANRDGILLLISMEYRDWYITTHGLCIDAFSDSTIESIGSLMSSDLGDGNYADAFHTYADECAYYIDGEINGFPFKFFQNLLVSLGIGLVVAFIATSIMKGKLKSVVRQTAAANYVKAGSLNVTDSGEYFLYRTVNRVAKPQNNGGSSTHRSSSGSTHGGGGGKF